MKTNLLKFITGPPTARKGSTRKEALAYFDKNGFPLSCMVCGWTPPVIKGLNYPGLEVHHIQPVSVGGTHDRYNLALMCATCHSISHKLWGKGGRAPRYRDEFLSQLRRIMGLEEGRIK